MMIREAALPEVWLLRQKVMYPSENLKSVQLDNDIDGIHLGVYKDSELLSVISLFACDKELQFRKFATSDAFQRQGVGTALLQHVMKWAATNDFEIVWCNARLSASGFYKRFGMHAIGESWKKNNIEYIKMQKNL